MVTEVETENVFVLESLTTSILVGSLHPYYTYVVSIHAVTILAGPYSDMIAVITLPEGIALCFLTCHTYVHVYNLRL